jgi:hypothetical protein
LVRRSPYLSLRAMATFLKLFYRNNSYYQRNKKASNRRF